MSLKALTAKASEHALEVFGILPALPQDGIGEGTLVLLGPSGPGFWSQVTAEAEFADGTANPLDRWSVRVTTSLASEFGGSAFFPFGEPRRPFISWVLRSGRAWQSPVRLLVHDKAGLMVSYRGAVLLPQTCEDQSVGPSPCDACQKKPCLTACPVGALTGEGYDLAACHAYLDTEAGRTNLLKGCEVRRACPVSLNYGRSEEQSAFHMKNFHPWP